MTQKISECPRCGKMIYSHAAMCPYCKKKTGFPPAESVVEQSRETLQQPSRQQGYQAATPQQQAAPSQTAATQERRQKKIPFEVTRKYSEVTRKYSKANIAKVVAIVLLALTVLGLFLAVQMQNRKQLRLASMVDHGTKDIIDSMANEVSLSGYVIAKFPERSRHCMYYLQDGHMYEFDAFTRDSKEMDLAALNSQALVNYEGSGILQANISPDESYIMIVASRNPSNTECGLYQMDTKTKAVAVLDRGKVTFDNGEYTVESGGRMARYDQEGTKLAGLTIEEAEALPKPQPKTEKKESTEETTEREEPRVRVTEQIQPKVDVVKQPTVPTEIKISPKIAPVTPKKDD